MLTPVSLILVCLLPAPRDLEIARLLGWYRIPFRTAPKVVAVDYLAFYQPGSFGEGSGRIEFTAEVRGHELTTRAELLRDEPEHPRAGEEYYKLQVGPLERLAHPIIAEKWRRLTARPGSMFCGGTLTETRRWRRAKRLSLLTDKMLNSTVKEV